jgi:hypothetical protein
MAGRRNRSRGWRRPAVVLARSSAYLPSILASNAVSVRGLRGLATPTLWGAALRQRCDRNVQRPRSDWLLEHDHSPECVARARPQAPLRCLIPPQRGIQGSTALSQLAWAHSKAVEATAPAPPRGSRSRGSLLGFADRSSVVPPTQPLPPRARPPGGVAGRRTLRR